MSPTLSLFLFFFFFRSKGINCGLNKISLIVKQRQRRERKSRDAAAAAADDDDDDDAREDAAAAPGRPFDSDKARGAESGRSRPRSKPNATSMNLTLRGCHATELCRTRPGSLHGARYNAIEEARSLRF